MAIRRIKIKSIYWHLEKTDIPTTPVAVKKGDMIGHGDSTGFSTGDHLHYGLKLLDSNGNVLNQNNGYLGAVDPLPYLVWFDTMSEKDVKSLQALEGYHDPDGVQFWVGKPLSEYLAVRLPDKIKTLNDAL